MCSLKVTLAANDFCPYRWSAEKVVERGRLDRVAVRVDKNFERLFYRHATAFLRRAPGEGEGVERRGEGRIQIRW